MSATSLVTTVIEPIYQQVCDSLSRADLWALFASLAVEHATSYQQEVHALPFTAFGRRDSKSCTPDMNRLPSAQGGLTEVTRTFVMNMGLTMDDAVTLIGAHSLGHVHTLGSGYGFHPQLGTMYDATSVLLNAWDETPTMLDNKYYLNMANEVSLYFSSDQIIDLHDSYHHLLIIFIELA